MMVANPDSPPRQGKCFVPDPDAPFTPPRDLEDLKARDRAAFESDQDPQCGILSSLVGTLFGGRTMDQVADYVSGMGRYVINRTGLSGTYNLRVRTGEGVDIFSGLGRLGLKFQSVKAPQGFIVIDHIEKPGPN